METVITQNALKLTPYDELDSYWKTFLKDVDDRIQENFWGNLNTYKTALQNSDPYIEQLCDMGYIFDSGNERPATFYDSMKWVFQQLRSLVRTGQIALEDVLIPGKAFMNPENQSVHFFRFGDPIENPQSELNILLPDAFTKMLAQGYFPIGEPITAHTNQTIAEHDLAHMAGMISSPRYMRALSQAFRKIDQKLSYSPQIQQALKHFDSLYSLRLYYMVEVFTFIRDEAKDKLAKLVAYPGDAPRTLNGVVDFLKEKAKDPAVFSHYLYEIYSAYPSMVDPVGGESRDIINRWRKFTRGDTSGTFYERFSKLTSKFDGSSIYSLYHNAYAALVNKRSTHEDFERSIEEIHAPFLFTLIGTNELTIEDWVFQAIEEVPDPNSKLNQYICQSGAWDKTYVLYWAHCHGDCQKVLDMKDMEEY